MRNDMDPYQKAIEDRIHVLLRYIRWMQDPPFMVKTVWRWADLELEYRQELRALLRVRSAARRELRVEARGDHFVGVGR